MSTSQQFLEALGACLELARATVAQYDGRLLGVRVRTGVSDGGTKVWVVDES